MEEVKTNIIQNLRAEDVRNVEETIENLLADETVKSILINNMIEFTYKDVRYRVRKPTYKERQEVFQKRCEKHVSFLKQKDEEGNFKYLSEKDLKDLYLSRGINIEKLENEIKSLRTQEKDLLIQLGKALKENTEEKRLELYKKDIQVIREQIGEKVIEKNTLLEFSIEHQMIVFIYSYYTMIMTEKLVNDKWERAWKTLDEHLDSDDELISMSASYSSVLIME